MTYRYELSSGKVVGHSRRNLTLAEFEILTNAEDIREEWIGDDGFFVVTGATTDPSHFRIMRPSEDTDGSTRPSKLDERLYVEDWDPEFDPRSTLIQDL